jgi:hypothetical protein
MCHNTVCVWKGNVATEPLEQPSTDESLLPELDRKCIFHTKQNGKLKRTTNLHSESGYLSGMALGYGLDYRGFEPRKGLGIFYFITVSRPALGPTQPPIQWVLGALSLEVKWRGREADHSPSLRAEVKNAWNYNYTPQYAFMAWLSVKAEERL